MARPDFCEIYGQAAAKVLNVLRNVYQPFTAVEGFWCANQAKKTRSSGWYVNPFSVRANATPVTGSPFSRLFWQPLTCPTLPHDGVGFVPNGSSIHSPISWLSE